MHDLNPSQMQRRSASHKVTSNATANGDKHSPPIHPMGQGRIDDVSNRFQRFGGLTGFNDECRDGRASGLQMFRNIFAKSVGNRLIHDHQHTPVFGNRHFKPRSWGYDDPG